MKIVDVEDYTSEELIAIGADIVIELRKRGYSDKKIKSELEMEREAGVTNPLDELKKFSMNKDRIVELDAQEKKFFKGSNKTYWVMEDYPIDKSRIKDEKDLIKWVVHLSGKQWMTANKLSWFILRVCREKGFEPYGV